MKRECETCIKRKTIYCPNFYECYNTEEMPHYQNRIMLLEENQKYKEVINKIDELAEKRLSTMYFEDGGEMSVLPYEEILDILEEVK